MATAPIPSPYGSEEERRLHKQVMPSLLRKFFEHQLCNDGFEDGYSNYVLARHVRPVRNPAGYVWRCATRWIQRELERRERNGNALVSPEQQAILDDIRAARAAIMGSAEARRVVAAMSDCILKLNKNDQINVTSFYLEGASAQEVAASLGMLVNAANVRRNRALEKLRDCIAEKLGSQICRLGPINPEH